jgi:arginyl-tRNA synthetase
MPSETAKIYLQHLLAESLSELKLTATLDADPQISAPEMKFGDFSTNAAMVLAKKLKANPKEIAEKLVEVLKRYDTKKVFSEIVPVGGFVNFRLSESFLLANLEKILSEKELYGASLLGQGKKILVEYFQPNVAKPLHLGHLRTAIIGDSLFRILKSQGFMAESDTHLGDWGTQFGLLILAFKKYGDITLVEKDPISELNKLYVRINTEIEAAPALREEGKSEFVKLEQGDEENRKLWTKFRDWSWKEYEVVYEDLSIRKADHDWPESFFEDKMPEVVKELKAKGLLVESQGAQIVDLEQYGLGIAVVVKSDGGTTYLLRDLATYIFRKKEGFEKQLYVVDVRQSHTLAQTFKILELAGYITSPEEAVHVAYGFLTLPEGAMSTRKGTVVGATEFIKNVQTEALRIIEEKNPDLSEKEIVAKKVAAAALKYFDLSHNLKSDIVFDPKTAISFEGNTGPYLQYTHARIHGILRKVSDDLKPSDRNKIPASAGITFKAEDFLVLRKLSKFPEVVEQVARELLPNLLCNYLFELSQNFNTFYEKAPILSETDENLKAFRLQLISATAQVLNNGLFLLGIDAPEEM